jgi:hypothetical protein
MISVGEAMPLIGEVSPIGPYSISVAWSGGRRNAEKANIDLAPLILTRKALAPLRDNKRLFDSVHVIEDGSAIAWGENDQFDISAVAIESLADEVMTTAQFSEFLRRHSLSFDAAAAQLGISRRLVAYYAKERQIPRYIALACAYLDQSLSV